VFVHNRNIITRKNETVEETSDVTYVV